MPLNEAGLVRYLADHALLDMKDVVDGGFVAIPSFRQNRNFRIHAGEGGGLFVKQPAPQAPQGAAGLAREAGFYWLVATTPPFDRLAGIVPRLVRYDEARAILILEEAKGVAPHRRQSLGKGFPPEIGTAVGDKIKAKAQKSGVEITAAEVQQATRDSLRALMLIRAYRVRGHFHANLDPLGLEPPKDEEELDPRSYGFTEADYDRKIFLDHVLGLEFGSQYEIARRRRQR